MKGIKVGVIVRKQCKKNGDETRRTAGDQKKKNPLRAVDSEAHQKFVNNLFAVIK
jgi:hypothetical protein